MAKTEIICAGFGGQGVLVTGLIIAHAAMNNDQNILWYPSYGVEMRGGTANCNVKISDEEIASPFVKEADIVIALNDASVMKFEERVKPGGYLFVNSSTVKPREYRKDIHVIMVPATDIANSEGNPRGANITVLGALAKTTGLFDVDYLRGAIDSFFEKKGKINPKNAVCFDKGAALFA
ncbi:MAG: oxidoreductase [Lachnospiraceae bacterium]|nr:oxidoreductase [Lachnospiraceae bacterium]